MQNREPEATQLQVAGVVTFYIVAALVMVFVNKAVLNNSPDLPFTFLASHPLLISIAVLLLRLLALLNRSSLRHLMPIEFELPMFNRSVIMSLLPYLTVGITGLIFNTLCLAGVDAAFFPGKGLLLPFTIGVSALHTCVRPRAQVIVAAFLVTCGFFIGTAPTFYRTSLSPESAIGLFYGCMSSLVLAVHAVLKKSALGHVGNSVISLSYFGNLFMATMLLPCLALHGELGVLRQRLMNIDEDWTTFIVGSLVTGVFGFLLGLSNSLSIKVTSPITHMFSSAAKGVIQTLLGVWIFSDIITLPRAYSILTITGGTVYYTWVQMSKPRQPFPKSDVEKQAVTEKPWGGMEQQAVFEKSRNDVGKQTVPEKSSVVEEKQEKS
ncbi:hypothetical protein B0H19DRAFT_950813 [Mycena capillaripes]|nr:hypothetical protein B0H19DRAFT_950813 [Mycena capillaripes]